MNLAEDDAEGRNRMAAFLQALQQLGWTDSHMRIDTRWGVGYPDLYRRYAVERGGARAGSYFDQWRLGCACLPDVQPALCQSCS